MNESGGRERGREGEFFECAGFFSGKTVIVIERLFGFKRMGESTFGSGSLDVPLSPLSTRLLLFFFFFLQEFRTLYFTFNLF